MARVRDEQKFNQCREALLAVGEELFINNSFNSVGLNDILREASIPKGSFYHYFDSKEDFGMQVVQHYGQQNLQALETLLERSDLDSYDKLKTFFQGSIDHYGEIDYCQGCLLANLSQELADVNEKLRCKINELSQLMVDRIAECLKGPEARDLNLGELNPDEGAQLLMNSWQGAVMKMKLQKSRQPLDMFMKFFFSR
ncbi:MAG: TetR family transcriptional regulator C-terminal domain-containing protein [Proteobacteria bacterium]|nr:TetR family transcriptional regulator C-terminal domain-containing protein [Pseudomonadota bacterium]